MRSRLEKAKQIIIKQDLNGILVSSPVNRRYLSGFTGTAGYLLITREENLFITDFRYIEQAKQQCPDFTVLMYSKEFADKLLEIISSRSIRHIGFEDEHITYCQYRKLKEKMEGVTLVPLGQTLNNVRMVKDEGELELIGTAARIADQAFQHILSYIKPGVKEKDIALELEYFMRRKGVEAPAFDFIVASGNRSALPHGVASGKEIEEGDFVTLDFGGVYCGYCSDMTRTVVVGDCSPRQQEIYNIVLNAQQKALEQMKAGMTGMEVDKISRDVIEEAGYGEYFGHGLGHGVGLLIHEAPTLNYKGNTVLEPGMVVTVEPGIYIPGFGGVRIEDLVVIGKKGIDNLTSSPKELIVL